MVNTRLAANIPDAAVAGLRQPRLPHASSCYIVRFFELVKLLRCATGQEYGILAVDDHRRIGHIAPAPVPQAGAEL
jgi:hypothetical protein